MSLKKDGKVTITVEVDFDMEDFKNHNVSKLTNDEWDGIEEMLRHRLESLPDGFFWDMFDEFVEDELDEMGHPPLGKDKLNQVVWSLKKED